MERRGVLGSVVHNARPPATRSAPTLMISVVTAAIATSTNPVRNVATIAPAVPYAESRPTVVPVDARSRSWSLTTAGGTALSTVAAGRNPIDVSTMIVPMLDDVPALPTARIVGTVAIASAPPAISSSGIRRRGSNRSAATPPSPAPIAMPASTVPMMPV